MKKNRNEFERDYCHLKDYDILKDALPLLLHIRLEIEEDLGILREMNNDLFYFYDGFLRRLEDVFVLENAPDGYDEALLFYRCPKVDPELDLSEVEERLDYNLHIYKSLLSPVAENEPVALLHALDSMKNLPKAMFFSTGSAPVQSNPVHGTPGRGRPAKTLESLVNALDRCITKEILSCYKFTVDFAGDPKSLVIKLNGEECCTKDHRRLQSASLISYMLYEAKKSPRKKIGFNAFYKTGKEESLKTRKKLPFTTAELQTASLLDDYVNYYRKTDGRNKWDGGVLNMSDIINGFRESVIRIVEKDLRRRLRIAKRGEVPALLMDAVMSRLIGANWKVDSPDIVFFNIAKLIEISGEVDGEIMAASNLVSKSVKK